MKDDFDFEGEKSPIPLPEIPQSFPELEKLTDVQLERLMTDEVALEVLLTVLIYLLFPYGGHRNLLITKNLFKK